MKTFLFALIVLFGLVAAAPLFRSIEPIENEYIVVFHNNVSSLHQNLHMKKFFARRDNSSAVTHTFQSALKGYAAKMPSHILDSILADPNVDYVEENGVVRALACVAQNNAVWGIKRIALAAPDSKNTVYNYPSEAGLGVTAYIIDTGIYTANVDFEGRASFGFQASGTGSTTDANGHGTHVASTVGGKTYGVAKKVNLVAVKVLGDNGSGTNAGVISGIDWVAANAKKPASANMSLGGGFSSAVNTAVNNLVDKGVVVAVAAGNDNNDAANYSPASAAKPITVGSSAETNSNGITIDTRSSFSNFGSSVDVFAPGSSITAAWIGSTTAINTISGTSMASPHVCGVASLLLSQGVAAANVKSTITSSAKTGLITLNCSGSNAAVCNASPNRMLYIKC